MKKYVSLLLTLALLLTLSVPAYAAVTDTFVDEIPADTANFGAEVVEFSSVGEDPNNSHKIAVENNPDLGKTLLLKTAAPRDAKWSEYIVYKMNKNICGFQLDVMCCAGLGNPLEDITVYLSKDGSAWNEVGIQATKYTYDEDIYVNFDKAYWHQSTVTNKKSIGTGFKYIKIQLNGCNESVDVPWNVAIDKITIHMGTKTDPVKISDEDKFETYDQINATKTTKGDGGNTTTAAQSGNTTTQGNSGNKTTTAQGGNKTTAAQNNKTTKAPVSTTTSINEKGEVVTEAPVSTTTSIDANGEVVTDAPVTDPTTSIDANGEVVTEAPVTDPTVPNEDGASQDVAGDNDGEKSPSALPYIIIGGVVVLAAAAVVVFVILKKKKA